MDEFDDDLSFVDDDQLLAPLAPGGGLTQQQLDRHNQLATPPRQPQRIRVERAREDEQPPAGGEELRGYHAPPTSRPRHTQPQTAHSATRESANTAAAASPQFVPPSLPRAPSAASPVRPAPSRLAQPQFFYKQPLPNGDASHSTPTDEQPSATEDRHHSQPVASNARAASAAQARRPSSQASIQSAPAPDPAEAAMDARLKFLQCAASHNAKPKKRPAPRPAAAVTPASTAVAAPRAPVAAFSSMPDSAAIAADPSLVSTTRTTTSNATYASTASRSSAPRKSRQSSAPLAKPAPAPAPIVSSVIDGSSYAANASKRPVSIKKKKKVPIISALGMTTFDAPPPAAAEVVRPPPSNPTIRQQQPLPPPHLAASLPPPPMIPSSQPPPSAQPRPDHWQHQPVGAAHPIPSTHPDHPHAYPPYHQYPQQQPPIGGASLPMYQAHSFYPPYGAPPPPHHLLQQPPMHPQHQPPHHGYPPPPPHMHYPPFGPHGFHPQHGPPPPPFPAGHPGASGPPMLAGERRPNGHQGLPPAPLHSAEPQMLPSRGSSRAPPPPPLGQSLHAMHEASLLASLDRLDARLHTVATTTPSPSTPHHAAASRPTPPTMRTAVPIQRLAPQTRQQPR